MLIADPAGEFARGIEKQLGAIYQVKICRSGNDLEEQLRVFRPDILVLDMMLPGIDCVSFLRAMRAAGNHTAVLAVLTIAGEYILSQLSQLKVKYVLTKPCTVNLAVWHIRQIGLYLQNPDTKDWCLENELESTLLNLGFRMGKPRYSIVCEGVLYKYAHPDSTVMKQIYPALAQMRGTTVTQVEKAIRDAIADAYENGDKAIWRMYFVPRRGSKAPYPTNEEFIARIAGCLQQKARLREPCTQLIEIAQ